MQRREAAPRRAACSAGLSWRRSPRRNQCTERQKPRGGDAAAAITGNRRGLLARPSHDPTRTHAESDPDFIGLDLGITKYDIPKLLFLAKEGFAETEGMKG